MTNGRYISIEASHINLSPVNKFRRHSTLNSITFIKKKKISVGYVNILTDPTVVGEMDLFEVCK